MSERDSFTLEVTLNGEVVNVTVEYNDPLNALRALNQVGKDDYIMQIAVMLQGNDDDDDDFDEDDDW